MTLQSTWATWRVLVQPGLQSETLLKTKQWTKQNHKTQLIKTEPTERCTIGRWGSLGFWRHKLWFFLGKECPCTAATSWQERSFCLREGLHWTKGNFGFVYLRMLDQKFKMNILGGAFQWILFIEFYFKIHSIGRGKYFVMGWGQTSSPKMRHLRCSWFRVPSATVLKKISCFSTCLFFPAQELVYNKIMENTLLQCTVESSPISRLYIGPKRKTCEPLHVGLPSIGTDFRAVFSSFHLS